MLMPIRPSSAAEIQQLIAALGGADEIRREAAVARLAVIGPRAVEHLLTRLPLSTSSTERSSILRVFERIMDPRALPIAREAASGGDEPVALAGVAVLRALLASRDAARDALDALVSIALDAARPADVRTAAFDAVRDLPRDVVEPVRARLAGDQNPVVRARAGGPAHAAGGGWRAAVAGELPAGADAMKALLSAEGPRATLTDLQHLIDHIRARELREGDPLQRAEWRAVRGALHQALAARGSRLALYDLRDSLFEPGPLPVTFLSALEEIGDATCVDSLVAAYDAASPAADVWWREHLASAFRAIARREGLTRRHLVVKRALARWPEATADLMAKS
jgi:hypothetical protein